MFIRCPFEVINKIAIPCWNVIFCSRNHHKCVQTRKTLLNSFRRKTNDLLLGIYSSINTRKKPLNVTFFLLIGNSDMVLFFYMCIILTVKCQNHYIEKFSFIEIGITLRNIYHYLGEQKKKCP